MQRFYEQLDFFASQNYEKDFDIELRLLYEWEYKYSKLKQAAINLPILELVERGLVLLCYSLIQRFKDIFLMELKDEILDERREILVSIYNSLRESEHYKSIEEKIITLHLALHTLHKDGFGHVIDRYLSVNLNCLSESDTFSWDKDLIGII